MNEQIIIDNLKFFLNKHLFLTKECEVIYFLVEIRKLIEDDQNKENYKILYFYCCWVIHSKLFYDKTAKLLSDKFDNYIDLQKKKREIQHDLINGQPDFFKLKDLNTELRTFLDEKELPINFLNSNAWYKFCKCFLNNIMECGIDFSEIKEKFCKINKLTVEKSNQQYLYRFYLVNGVQIPGIILKLKN